MMENKYINYIYIGLIVVLILALVNLIFALKVKSDQSKLFDELQVVKSDQSQFFNELQAGRMHLITDVPYIINHSGNYGLENDLNCPGLDGYCIEIRADNVTLDLKGYSLSHTSRLHDQRTIGIYAKNRKYCTIINGNIEGFFTAIHIEDVRIGEIYSPQYGLHHIENIAASNNTFRAIYVEGLSNTINNNVIINTGGTPYSNDARVYGIESMGSFTQIKNNQILETCATDQGEGVGISTVSGEATLIKNNIIANTKPPLYDNWGIWASGDRVKSNDNVTEGI